MLNSTTTIKEECMNKNFWGEPDDIEPLPDWMLAETYRDGGQPKKRGKTLQEAIEDALKKPAIPIILQDPTKD
jgi:hypothetical protein